MKSWGVILALVGASQFVLPRLGMQHVVFRIFHPYEIHAAVGLIVVGLVMVGLSFRKKPAKKA